MEFPFRLPSTIGAPPGHSGPYIGCLDDRSLRGMTSNLMTVLDTIGKRSATAQGLKKPVTYGSAASLFGQRVYLLVEDRRALGFIKVGAKNLFVAPPPLHATRSNHSCVQDAFKEINPLCVLDFYVHESCQRSGFGKQLFDRMLQQEGKTPSQLAYDRPSPKFLGFLRKHCGLSRYQPQNNNYVVFDEFFAQGNQEPRAARSLSVRRKHGTPADSWHGDSTSRGILPYGEGADPPPVARRPPIMPDEAPQAYVDSTRAVASTLGDLIGSGGAAPDMLSSDGAASTASSRPPRCPSSASRPPICPAPSMQRGAARGLQTPWGTAADALPLQAPRDAREAGTLTPASGVESSFAAGMPSGGKARSVSLPCRGQTQAPHMGTDGGHGPLRGLGSSGGSVSGSSRRFASPLSHAGIRMLAL